MKKRRMFRMLNDLQYQVMCIRQNASFQKITHKDIAVQLGATRQKVRFAHKRAVRKLMSKKYLPNGEYYSQRHLEHGYKWALHHPKRK